MNRVTRALALTGVLVSLAATGAHADPAPPGPRVVDLRDAASLERLRRDNPAHYAVIGRILEDLTREPARVESDWLQARFDVRDVELSRALLKTSHPPRQLLQFTLDDTRYALHVVRSDLTATPAVLR